MKFKLALAIILLLLIIGCGVFQIVIINQTMDHLSEELEILDSEVNSDNFDMEKIYDLEAYWHKRLPMLETIIPNTDIDQVAMLISELIGAMENKDQKETHIRIEVLKVRAESIKHLLGFRIEHIL